MKRILVFLLALCALVTFAACGSDDGGDETTPVDASNYTTRADDDSDPVTTSPEQSSSIGETTLADGSTTADGATSTAPGATDPVGPDTPSGTAAIVKFYNDAANNTKSQKNFTAVKSDKLNCNITEGALTIIDSLLNDLRSDKPNQKEVFVNGKGTINSGNTPQKFLPVSGQSYMSKLEPGWVQSATCTKNANGTFTINLKLKEESFLAVTGDAVHHHSCMDTLDIDWAGLPVKVHDQTKGRVHDATIKAVVNKEGTLLQEVHIYEPVEVKGQVQVVVWADITVEGYWKQDITFTY